MSQYRTPSAESNSRGLQILVILAGLILVGSIQIRNDQKPLNITALNEGGILLSYTSQEWLNSNRHIHTAAYGEEGKELWKREYKPLFTPMDLERTALVSGPAGWEIYTADSRLRLDSKGRFLGQDKEVNWVEDNLTSSNSESEEIPESSPQDWVDGDLRYRLSEDPPELQAYLEDQLFWSFDPAMEFSFLGRDPRDLKILAGEPEGLRLSLTMTADKKDSLPWKERPFRFSVLLDSDYQWLEESYRLEDIFFTSTEPKSRGYYYLNDQEFTHRGIHYSLRKGLLKAEDGEGNLLWKERVFFPVLAVLENFF